MISLGHTQFGQISHQNGSGHRPVPHTHNPKDKRKSKWFESGPLWFRVNRKKKKKTEKSYSFLGVEKETLLLPAPCGIGGFESSTCASSQARRGSWGLGVAPSLVLRREEAATSRGEVTSSFVVPCTCMQSRMGRFLAQNIVLAVEKKRDTKAEGVGQCFPAVSLGYERSSHESNSKI